MESVVRNLSTGLPGFVPTFIKTQKKGRSLVHSLRLRRTFSGLKRGLCHNRVPHLGEGFVSLTGCRTRPRSVQRGHKAGPVDPVTNPA